MNFKNIIIILKLNYLCQFIINWLLILLVIIYYKFSRILKSILIEIWTSDRREEMDHVPKILALNIY